jgi:hypothetical protein
MADCIFLRYGDQESISSTFYAHINCTKVFWAAFPCLEFGFEQTFVQKMFA